MEIEIKKIAKERVKFIVSLIEYILKNDLDAKLDIGIVDDCCVLEINILEENFIKRLNIIEKEYDYLIYEELFKEILKQFVSLSYIKIGPLCRARDLVTLIGEDTGLCFSNLNSNLLKLSFYCMTNEGRYVFNEQGNLYNQELANILGKTLTHEDIMKSYIDKEVSKKKTSKVL